ncbi:MAG: hypothetical protein JRE28_05310 [Deltaproteobacteria bacterium]|nr:hypothetical protein [Deltaproteobacteria bacterium]
MKKSLATIVILSLVCMLVLGCGSGKKVTGKLEIPLMPSKGYTGGATGTVVINADTGTDISIKISGLDSTGLYTAFFINMKSRMFSGIGEPPYVIQVNPNGEADIRATMEKNIYLKFVRVGIFLNPGDKPVKNPLGIKSKLGALLKTKKPKLILEGKLR